MMNVEAILLRRIVLAYCAILIIGCRAEPAIDPIDRLLNSAEISHCSIVRLDGMRAEAESATNRDIQGILKGLSPTSKYSGGKIPPFRTICMLEFQGSRQMELATTADCKEVMLIHVGYTSIMDVKASQIDSLIALRDELTERTNKQ